MKKIFFLLALGYSFLFFGNTRFASSLFAQATNPTLNVSPVIPAFIFTDPNSGQDFTPASLPTEVVKMFFFYDPACDHCQQAAASIAKSADKFKNVQLTWISKPQTSRELIQKFKETYFGTTKLNLHFVNGKGPNPYFGDIVAMPCVFIYGCKDQFVQRLTREEITGENLSRFTLCQ